MDLKHEGLWYGGQESTGTRTLFHICILAPYEMDARVVFGDILGDDSCGGLANLPQGWGCHERINDEMQMQRERNTSKARQSAQRGLYLYSVSCSIVISQTFIPSSYPMTDHVARTAVLLPLSLREGCAVHRAEELPQQVFPEPARNTWG